jgi:hypothetical protein
VKIQVETRLVTLPRAVRSYLITDVVGKILDTDGGHWMRLLAAKFYCRVERCKDFKHVKLYVSYSKSQSRGVIGAPERLNAPE